MKYILPALALLLIACSGSKEDVASDADRMRDEVRNYLFLDDSIEVKTVVQDTISKDEVDGMLANVEENLNLIQQDIDTLESIIDTIAYQNMAYEATLDVYPEGIPSRMGARNYNLAKHQLKMAELQAKKLTFQQSKRVMLHLKRSSLKSVGGYEILASYSLNGEQIELNFLMDSEFNIVD